METPNETSNVEEESNQDEENRRVDRRQILITILGRALEVSAPPTIESASITSPSTSEQPPSIESQRRLNDAVQRSLLAAATRQAACRERRLRLGHQESRSSGNDQEEEEEEEDDDEEGDINGNDSIDDETSTNNEGD